MASSCRVGGIINEAIIMIMPSLASLASLFYCGCSSTHRHLHNWRHAHIHTHICIYAYTSLRSAWIGRVDTLNGSSHGDKKNVVSLPSLLSLPSSHTCDTTAGQHTRICCVPFHPASVHTISRLVGNLSSSILPPFAYSPHSPPSLLPCIPPYLQRHAGPR